MRDAAVAAPVCYRPDEPLLTLRPRMASASFHLREAWAYRELLVFLTWRELKVRYKQTGLGAAWAIVQPLLPMVTFTFTLGRVVGVPSDGAPYALFVYAALLPWTFFASAVTTSTNSVIGNANLISKVYFPRLIIPAAAVLGALADFVVGFSIPRRADGVVSHSPPSPYPRDPRSGVARRHPRPGRRHAVFRAEREVSRRAARPPVCGAGLDVRDSRGVFLRASFRRVAMGAALNPMTGVVEGFRSAVLGRPFQLMPLAISAGIAVALLIGSVWFFRRAERTFADTI